MGKNFRHQITLRLKKDFGLTYDKRQMILAYSFCYLKYNGVLKLYLASETHTRKDNIQLTIRVYNFLLKNFEFKKIEMLMPEYGNCHICLLF